MRNRIPIARAFRVVGTQGVVNVVGIVLVLFVATVAAVAASAHADGLTRSDVRCVPQSIRTVYDWLLNYDKYKNLDDNVGYEIVGRKYKLVDMIHSSPAPYPSGHNDVDHNDSAVFIVLRPLSSTDGRYYARLLIHCVGDFSKNGTFNHYCDLDERNDLPPSMTSDNPLFVYRNFGLSKFSTVLHAESYRPELKVPGCQAGQTLLQYSFRLDANPEQVNQIKTSALGPFARLSSVFDAFSGLFDNGTFFSWYYQEFYNAWASSIPGK